MNYSKFRELNKKLYFKVNDVAALLKVKPASARVICHRYARKGLFISLKNNFYILAEQWEKSGTGDFYRIANFLQVPSYISFTSALSYHGATTQVQRNFIESACVRRSKQYRIRETVFNFFKLKKELYFDFRNAGNLFMASAEKAFLDSVYLQAYGKYKFDNAAVDHSKLNKSRIRLLLKRFPEKIKSEVKKYAGFD